MATLSFRASLLQIGEPGTDHGIPPWPGGFHCSPRKLKAALLAMRPPRIRDWVLHPFVNTFENFVWTEECNGVTTDSQFWYFASSNNDLPAIHKFTLDFKHVGRVALEKGIHIGDIDYFNGHIFAPLEPHPKRVAVFDTTPALVSVVELDDASSASGSPHKDNPWCAINPINGFLYSSNFDSVDRIYAYDPKSDFRYRGTLQLRGPAVGGVQGGAFTTNGHFYLTSDVFKGKNATKDIRAYSSLNGEFLGSKQVPYDASFTEAEEMEGFVIFPFGPLGQVHIVILDNDLISSDDVFLKHFVVPDLDVL